MEHALRKVFCPLFSLPPIKQECNTGHLRKHAYFHCRHASWVVGKELVLRPNGE